jgi:CRP/FNR family cyclic AMP-dependent transcriptional regulator
MSEPGMAADRASVIRSAPLLANVEQSDVQALAELSEVREFAADEVICREGDPGDGLHTIVRGTVRIFVVSREGKEATLATIGRGDSIGELALLDGRERSANASAIEATTTLRVGRADFRGWLTDRSAAAVAVLETLSLRLRRSNDAVADLSFLELPQRIAKRLLQLHLETVPDASGERRIRITQSALASMVGSSREAVNKHLKLFEQTGWVGLGRGAVSVLNADVLRGQS